MAKSKKKKLSGILIEIAMQGLKDEKYYESEVMHPLMSLAHVAWNRDTSSPKYCDNYKEILAEFKFTKKKLEKELISGDWDIVLEKMIDYKRKNYPDDMRFITMCAYTPWGTLRVEWDPDTE